MKKLLLILMVITLLFTFTTSVSANGIQPKVLLNNVPLDFPDAQPFIDENKRVLVPARVIAEALGAEVEWNEIEQKVTIKKRIYLTGDVTTNFYIGKKQYEQIGGPFEGKKTMDTKAITKEGRLYVPVRYVVESLYSKVYWDSKFSRVLINANDTKIKKDPIVGWIKVEIDTAYVDYYMNILVHTDLETLLPRFDAAEKMIAERYGKDIAKQVMDYARKKQSRSYELPRKEFKFGNRVVLVEGGDISTSISFRKP